MSNEQAKELLDMTINFPESKHFHIKFEYDNEHKDVSIFVHGVRRCDCCGHMLDETGWKMSDKYDVIKEFIEEWAKITEKENENDRGDI